MNAVAAFAERYDAHMAGGLMDRYYRDCAYFNVGVWRDENATITEAAERLVEAVAAPIPGSATSILDVGCGLGGTTQSLSRRFPSARVAGLNLSLSQLARGTRGNSRVCADAEQLPFARASFDAVVAVESLQHFRDRKSFFDRVQGVLAPGGTIAFSDLLVRDRDAFGAWMFPAEQPIESIDAYREMLQASGWTDIVLTDATDACWRGFCRSWERFAHELRQQNAITASELAMHESLVQRWQHGAVHAYVIGSARKGAE